MGSFKKFLHHVNIEDVKKKHLEEIAAKKLKEERQKEEKEFIVNTMKEIKYDWRSSLYEKMSTGTAFAYTASGQPDADVATIDASLETSFGHDQRGVEAHGYSPSGLMGGVAIKPSGSGTGENGGFDIGDHLAFTGDTNYNVRWAALNPIDSTAIDTITITAIRGNDSNGGEDPDAEGEDLEVWYRNADMGQNMWTPINQDPAGNTISGVEKIIIPIGSDSSGLRDWTLPIPAHARTTSTQFMLFQATSSGAEYDHYGVTKISFKRNAPVNVVVSLDDPAASAFIRVGGPAGEESDPKKRKKKINDQLGASDEYTQSQLGDEFPGAGTRVGGDDPFASAEIGDDVKPSPIGKDEVTRSFADFKNLTDKQKINQSKEYLDDYIKTFSDGTYNDPESLEILDRAIEINPKNVDAYFYRSFAYFDNQNYDDALADTERILELNPNDPDIPYMRAIIYREKGDLELSLEEIKKSLETYPDDPYLEDMKAEVEDQIVQEYRAKQVPPDADEEGSVVKRQTYYDDVSKKLAPEDTEDQQLVSTNLAQAKDLMTSTHYNRGRDGIFSKGAIDLLQDAYAVEPNNPEILSNLGVALMMGGKAFDGEGGEYYLERAQALDPNVEFDFNIKSWDRYDGEETQPYAGARIDKLYNLPYRYARDIIKNLPDQSTAKGATYGATDSDYAEKYGGSYSKYYTDKAKGKSTEVLQRMLVSAAREIEDNKYWMEDLSRHPTFSGNTDVVYVPGYVLGGTKWTGALNGVTQEDWERENEKMNNWPTDEAGYYKPGWREQWEKTRKVSLQLSADRRSRGISAGVKMDVEKYQAYYNEYMKRGEPDAIEKVDVPEAGKFIDAAQKEIIEKAISEPEKLFKLSEKQAETLRKVLTPQGGKGGISVEYIANLPFALGISILTGKPMELFVSDAEAIKIAQDINADELAKVLRIDNPVPTTAREAIEPSEGKTDQVIKSLFGSQGGLYFNYDTETKQLYIESRKTLRTTSGGESIETFRGDLAGDILFQLPNLSGTGTKFTDIPVPTTDQLNELGAKFVFNTLYNPFMKAKATFDALKKTGGNPIEIKNVIFDALAGKIEHPDQLNPNAPRTIWDEKSGKMMNNYDYSIAGMKQYFDQDTISQMIIKGLINVADTNINAIAANLVAIRKVLTDIGIPASDIEKFGGAYGMTYSSTPVNYDDLPDDVKAVIDAAVGTPQGKPDVSDYQKKRSALSLDDPFVKDDGTEVASVNYDLYNWYVKTYGSGAAGWYLNNPGSSPSNNPFLPAGSYVPKAQKNSKSNTQVAHYKPRGTFMRETTFNKLKKIRKKYDYEGKPSPDGLPENDPPQLDPKTGMHPRYGKNANRYGKLDPISAKAMARVKTGDPETDASVQKQAKKPK